MFRGAILESGSYAEFQDYFSNIVTLAMGETQGTTAVPSGAAIADSVGCTSQTTSFLRSLPPSTMLGTGPFPFVPILDGTRLTPAMSPPVVHTQFHQSA